MAVADHRIDTKRAAYSSTPSRSPPKTRKTPSRSSPANPSPSLTRTEQGEELAPEGATAGPPEEETLQSILVAEVRRRAQESRKLGSDQTARIAHYEQFVQSWEGGTPINQS